MSGKSRIFIELIVLIFLLTFLFVTKTRITIEISAKVTAIFFNSNGDSTPGANTLSNELRGKLLAEAARLENYREIKNLRDSQEQTEAIKRITDALSKKKIVLGKYHPYVSDSYQMLGILYRETGDYNNAEKSLRNALEIREKVYGKHVYVADTAHELGSLLEEISRYNDAEYFMKLVLDIRKELKTRNLMLAASYHNLGLLYLHKGQYDEAASFLDEGRQIFDNLEGISLDEQANYYYGLGDFYLIVGDEQNAEKFLNMALEKSPREDSNQNAIFYNGLGSFYWDQGEYTKAKENLEKALAIADKNFGEDSINTITIKHNLSSIYYDLGDYSKGEKLLNEVIKKGEQLLGKEHPQMLTWYANLGTFYFDKREYTKAELLFKDTFDIAKKLNHPNISTFANNLAALYIDMGKINEAKFYIKVVNDLREKELVYNLVTGSERQKTGILAETRFALDRTIAFHLQKSPEDLTMAQIALTEIFRRKGRVLDSVANTITNLRRRANKEDLGLLEQWQEAVMNFTNLRLEGQSKEREEALAEYQQQCKRLETTVEELEVKLSLRNKEFKIITMPTTLQSVQQAIPESALLVEFILYQPYNIKARKYDNPHYAVYLTDKTEKIEWQDLGEAEKINQEAEKFYQALEQKETLASLKDKARKLDWLVMEPVRKLGSRFGKKERILVSPDGIFNKISFDALVDETGKYLVENHEISYLTSGRDLLRLQSGISTNQLGIVLASPNYGEGEGTLIGDVFVRATDKLTGANNEAKEIQEIFNLPKENVLLGDQVTKARLLNLNSPKFLHIAVDGFFLKNKQDFTNSSREVLTQKEAKDLQKMNPMLRSGLLLKDANRNLGNQGLITATEISTLNLFGTQLVVLSACESALGKSENGEGVYGMRRALVLAGSASQLLTLWEINDEKTKEIMSSYYKSLKAKEKRSASLTKVKRDFLEKYKDNEYSHPYYWASFVLSGAWDEFKQ